MRTRFGRFDCLLTGGTAYQPVSQDGREVLLLRCDGGGAVERFTHARLDELRASGPWRYQRGFFAPSGAVPARPPDGSLLTGLSAEQRGRVLFLHNACVAIGEMHVAGQIALTYEGLDRCRDRLAATVNAREVGRNLVGRSPRGGERLPLRQLPCAKTLLEHYRRFRLSNGSPDSLVPRPRADGPCGAVTDLEAEELLRECVWGFASPSRPTKAKIVDDTRRRFETANEARAHEGLRPLRTFSRRTVERRIDRLPMFTVACHRDGVDAARRAFSTYGTGLPVGAPMERVEIDEWQADVRTLFGSLGITKAIPPHVRDRLPAGRRWICAAIDCATRCFVGVRVADRPSSDEAVALLRMVVSDKTDVAREVGARSPWPCHGGLGTVVTDAGSALQSDAFVTAVTDPHGALLLPPVKAPELRGRMERAFGTMATSLMPLLSGRTFSNPVGRGDYDSEARTVLDDEDLLRILLTWIVDVYHHTPHDGLRGQTPAERWRGLAAERFVAEAPDRHDRRTALGVEVVRKLSNRGVLLFGNHYACPELRDLYRRSRDQDVRVRIDPEDIGAVSVEVDGAWHEAPAMDGGLDGISLAAWRAEFTRMVERHRGEAQLSQQVRDDGIASIRARVDLKVSLLIPGSLGPSAREIDHLDRQHFHGRSFAPRGPAPDQAGRRSPFGTVIEPAPGAPPGATGGTHDRAGDFGPARPAPRTWSVEDE